MKKKSKIVITLTSRFVAINAHQCNKCYLLMSSTAKSYNFPKLSEAWVIFHGSKPEKKLTQEESNVANDRDDQTGIAYESTWKFVNQPFRCRHQYACSLYCF